MNKGGRPKLKETIEQKKLFIKPGDFRYKRITKYSDEDFVNSIIFEFYLRDEEFINHYQSFKKKLIENKEELNNQKDSYSTYQTIKLEYEKKFKEFGYDILDIKKYIVYTDYDEMDEGFRNRLINLDYVQNVNEKTIQKNMAITLSEELNGYFSKLDEKYYNLLNGNNSEIDFSMYQKLTHSYFISHHYNHKTPTLRVDYINNCDFNNIPLKHFTINIQHGKKANLEQMKVLINSMYSTFQEEKNESLKISNIVGKQNPKATFATYFYIYDNMSNNIRISFINNELAKSKKNISGNPKTIKNVYKKMCEYMKNRKFLGINI